MRNIARMIVLLFLWPLCVASADDDVRIPGWTAGVYSLASGLWEETGAGLKNQRYDHVYSWGKTMVIPNYGVIIELGTTNPFVMWDGEPFPVTAITSTGDGIVDLDLKDESTTGARAFVTLRILFAGDGTARMDFLRADGSRFGETGYMRVTGPAAK